MSPEPNNQIPPSLQENAISKRLRVALGILLLLFATFAVVAIVAPRIFKVDRYRSEVISLLEQRTGRRVEIQRLRLAAFPTLSIQVDGFAIGNPPDFPEGNWLSVKRIRARLDLDALWHRQIVIRALDLEDPVLSLLSDSQGKSNYEMAPPSMQRDANDCATEVGVASGHGFSRARRLAPYPMPLSPLALSPIALRSPHSRSAGEGTGVRTLQERRYAARLKPCPDTLTLDTLDSSQDPSSSSHPSPDHGNQPLFQLRKVSRLGIKGGSLTMIPHSTGHPSPAVIASGISAQIQHILLSGWLAPGEGAKAGGAAGASGLLASRATGKLAIANLGYGGIELTDVRSGVEASPEQVILNPIRFRLCKGKGTAAISVDLAKTGNRYKTQATFSGVDVAKLLTQLPAWQGKMTGTLDGKLTLSGTSSSATDPWADKQGEGEVVIRNGRFPRLKVSPTLLQLARVAQLGPSSGKISSFSSIVAHWRLADDILTTPSIQLSGVALNANVSGSALLAGPGRLDYHGTAAIPARINSLTNILAQISGARLSGGKLTFSFAIHGTLAKPVFSLVPHFNISHQHATSPNQAPQMLQNLFNLFKPRKP